MNCKVEWRVTRPLPRVMHWIDTMLPKKTHQDLQPSAWSGSFASVRDLEILHTVIQERKTTAAASKLGISQPAVSRTLAHLEARSGRVLFRREGLYLAPTADALALYEATRPIFDALAELRDFKWAEGGAQALRIAAPPTIAHCLLEPIIAKFLAQAPSAKITLEIATTPAVLELISDQRVDIGMADVAAPASIFHRIPLHSSSLVCAVREDHPLAGASHVRAQDLHEQPMVLLVKRNPARALIDRFCTKAGVRLNVVIETSNALSALRLAASGAGATLINPFPAALAPVSGMRFIPFEPTISFETAFFQTADTAASSTVQRFVEFTREQIGLIRLP